MTGAGDTLLVVNAGSSSIKFQLFDVTPRDGLGLAFKGQLEGIGTKPRLAAKDAAGAMLIDEAYPPGEVGGRARGTGPARGVAARPARRRARVAIGHRVVHGGPDFDAPILVDDAVLERLERLVPLAPLHQPNNLAPIREIRARRPEIPQVACFDTAFHRGHPEVADRFAIADSWYQEGVRRYGFHGLSYEYIADRLREVDPALAQGRVVVCHLGSGASMCALHAGRSLDSTMGFTAVDGLPMGTRTGQLDPGVVLYLLQAKGFDAGADRALPLPRWRPQGPVGRQQRRARPARQRRAGCGARARLFRLSDRPRERARSRRRWTGSTASCSPPASASTARTSAGG